MRGLRLQSWKVARIHGVELKVHFSLLFLLLYVLLLASAQFPYVLRQSGINPVDLSGGPFIWGMIFALGLFLSVVIHEFAHVLMAQSMGVPVRGITLMMLGGVSEMERIPDEKYAEFKVSIVGPLTSFALAAALYFAFSQTGSAEVAFFSYWLSRVNLVLAIFNLLPAFPLDGGRALRSILAAKQGMANATQTTVRVAKGMAIFLGLLGFLSFNLLLMLIAIFIYSAAASELLVSVSRGLLKDVKASQIVTRAEPVHEGAFLNIAADEMLHSRHEVIPVIMTEGPPAILSAQALKRVPPDQWESSRVGQMALRPGKVLNPESSLDEVLPELATFGAIPVVEAGRLVGVVTHQDLTELIHLKSLEETRRSRPSGWKPRPSW